MEQNRVVTQQAVDALEKAGVLTPWRPAIRVGDEDKEIAGLFRIDEDKLNRMDDQAFLRLRIAGALPLAYAHLFSLVNMGILKKLAESRQQQEKVQISRSPTLANCLAMMI